MWIRIKFEMKIRSYHLIYLVTTTLLRYNLMSKECVALFSDGCLSLERKNYLMSELQRVHSEMKKIPIRQESIETMVTAEEICLGAAANADDNVSVVNVVDNETHVVLGEGTNERSATGHGECTLERLKNPDVGASKGRPKM
jgi:hypothetical protein